MFPRKYFFFYETRKKRGNKKSFVNGKGVFQYSCILLRLGNTLELTHLGASLGEDTLQLEPPPSAKCGSISKRAASFGLR